MSKKQKYHQSFKDWWEILQVRTDCISSISSRTNSNDISEYQILNWSETWILSSEIFKVIKIFISSAEDYQFYNSSEIIYQTRNTRVFSRYQYNIKWIDSVLSLSDRQFSSNSWSYFRINNNRKSWYVNDFTNLFNIIQLSWSVNSWNSWLFISSSWYINISDFVNLFNITKFSWSINSWNDRLFISSSWYVNISDFANLFNITYLSWSVNSWNGRLFTPSPWYIDTSGFTNLFNIIKLSWSVNSWNDRLFTPSSWYIDTSDFANLSNNNWKKPLSTWNCHNLRQYGNHIVFQETK